MIDLGSPRYYKQHFDDAIAITHRFGMPSLFITMTFNPNWPEVKEAINITIDGITLQQDANFRPDIIARVFKLKVKQLLNDIMKRQIFGKALAYVGTIEYQKRGFPHLHLLVILSHDDKKFFLENLDCFVCAELPNKTVDKELHKLVDEFMVHSPCGKFNPKASCMIGEPGNERCRHRFPKE